MEMINRDMMMQFGTLLTTMAFTWALFQQYLPDQFRYVIRSSMTRYSHKLVYFFSPYQDITFDEYTGEFFDRSEVYSTIETYISEMSSDKARRLKANFLQGKSLMLSMAEYEEVTDEFRGIKVWWTSNKSVSKSSSITIYPGSDEKRFYRLSFHWRHRDMITTTYLNYVLEEGKAIKIRKRTRKLYTNIQEEARSYRRSKNSMWCHVEFKHPARFETLAMESKKKQRIVKDLMRFSNAKDYYERIGKAWKRGYLLYGPPGTGKSTMVAAMANLLEYDIYDLELTAVKDNVHLRRLLIETTSKSIILIEDIDCSLDLTGKRKKEEKKEGREEDEKDAVNKALKEVNKKKESEVTLSGLLNFIDGIWSACGEERIIVFTTNYVEKLDPALIRRGRMDIHIELSYCCFESFKVLAKNYLELDAHPLFRAVQRLLEETDMSPADVAEHLMIKSDDSDANECLESLVDALKKAKEDAEMKKEMEKEEAEKEGLLLANGSKESKVNGSLD
ncbi:hypothetical protein V2J09_012450 [Rumex salicifolius]